MAQDKISTAREWLLARMESGSFGEGDRLPGARELASETGISLLTAQAAIKTLARDGVLELRARSGCYVKPGWRDVPLESRLYHFSPGLPWVPRFERLMARRLPSMKLSRSFRNGIFEVRTTLDLLSHRSDYMDVSRLFREAFPDSSVFYDRPFRGFRQDGRLLGVPFIFSPRVIVYNRKVFKSRGCPEPRPGWTWDGFIDTLRMLKAAGQPKDRIFSLTNVPHDWMNFVLIAGGSLFDPSASDPVRIDSDATRRGLRLYSQVQAELGNGLAWSADSHDGALFVNEGMAMAIMPREFRTWLGARSFEAWGAIELPSIPDGVRANVQGTDLLCVRRECKDHDLAIELMRFLLSEETQDFIGDEKYGIPIRKSSAMKSLDARSPRDKVFFDQIENMSADYNLDSPDLSAMISEGLSNIWRSGSDIDSTTAEIASAVRTYLKVKSYGKRGG